MAQTIHVDRVPKALALTGLLVVGAALLAAVPAQAHDDHGSRSYRRPSQGSYRSSSRSNRTTRYSRDRRWDDDDVVHYGRDRDRGRHGGGDTDGDGYPDHADSDIDADGIRNEDDPDPYRRNIRPNVVIRNPNRDTDGDGYRDNDDSDIDGDGIRNEDDSTPLGGGDRYGSSRRRDRDDRYRGDRYRTSRRRR